jgi:hypothetical protein
MKLPETTRTLIAEKVKVFDLEHPLQLELNNATTKVLNQHRTHGYRGVTQVELESLFSTLTNFVRLKGNFVWDGMREIITDTHCEYYPELGADLRELLDTYLKPLIVSVERETERFRQRHGLAMYPQDEVDKTLHIVLPNLYSNANIFAEKHRNNMNKPDKSIAYPQNIITGSGNVIQQGSGHTASVHFNSEGLFKEMRKVIESQIEAGIKQTELLTAVDAMESSKGTPTFLSAYQSFMVAAANHVTVFAPFIAPLAKMLSGG